MLTFTLKDSLNKLKGIEIEQFVPQAGTYKSLVNSQMLKLL